MCACSKSFQSCLTLCNPMDIACQAPLSMGILQARILEWVASSSSRGSSRPREWTLLSCVSWIGRQVLYPSTTWEACGRLVAKLCQTLATQRTVAYQASLSMGFPRQEYWSGLSFPSPGDLPNPGTEPLSLMSPELVGRFFTSNATREAIMISKEY